jgi:L-aspartate oxidase
MCLPVETPRLFATPDPRPCGWAGGTGLPDEAAVRDLMWRAAGLIRTRRDLEDAAACLGAWHGRLSTRASYAARGPEGRRLASLVTVGLLIACAALRREESRGAHVRADFPDRDDSRFGGHLCVRRSGNNHH